jgi:hypothetical protein
MIQAAMTLHIGMVGLGRIGGDMASGHKVEHLGVADLVEHLADAGAAKGHAHT